MADKIVAKVPSVVIFSQLFLSEIADANKRNWDIDNLKRIYSKIKQLTHLEIKIKTALRTSSK